MRKLLLCFIALLFISNSFAQIKTKQNEKTVANFVSESENLKFTEFKAITEQNIVVYFCISNIENETQKQKILTELQSLSFVNRIRIYKDVNNLDRCQIEIPFDTKPKQIRDILIRNNTDFEFIFVKIKK